jgi:hypothetical protein
MGKIGSGINIPVSQHGSEEQPTLDMNLNFLKPEPGYFG